MEVGVGCEEYFHAPFLVSAFLPCPTQRKLSLGQSRSSLLGHGGFHR